MWKYFKNDEDVDSRVISSNCKENFKVDQMELLHFTQLLYFKLFVLTPSVTDVYIIFGWYNYILVKQIADVSSCLMNFNENILKFCSLNIYLNSLYSAAPAGEGDVSRRRDFTLYFIEMFCPVY